MKVNQSGNSPVQGHETIGAKPALHPKGGRRTEGGAEGATTARGAGAKLEISEKGKEFAKVKAAAVEAPEVREEKIAALRKKIAEGSYKPNNEAIADRMVDEHLKMSDIG
jgi:negative regulator of flagellin synthesis FlgM